MIHTFSEDYIRTKWEKSLRSIFDREKDIDLLLFMNVPLNFIRGITEKIKSAYGIPVACYDGDMPTILPKYAPERGFKFNYYLDADLSVFDAFFTNSKGIIPDLKEMGAQNVHPLFYAADPDVFRPVNVNKTIDISFYGHGSELREEWMRIMITEPSDILFNRIFSVGGIDFDISLGKANIAGYLDYSEFRRFCCQSRICLNITRCTHSSV
jgi:spore maturation protein CgeB